MKTFENREEALAYIDTLPFNQVREMLATCLIEQQIDKVTITLEQAQRFFKIRGLRAVEGGFIEENRGKDSVGRGGRKERLV